MIDKSEITSQKSERNGERKSEALDQKSILPPEPVKTELRKPVVVAVQPDGDLRPVTATATAMLRTPGPNSPEMTIGAKHNKILEFEHLFWTCSARVQTCSRTRSWLGFARVYSGWLGFERVKIKYFFYRAAGCRHHPSPLRSFGATGSGDQELRCGAADNVSPNPIDISGPVAISLPSIRGDATDRAHRCAFEPGLRNRATFRSFSL